MSPVVPPAPTQQDTENSPVTPNISTTDDAPPPSRDRTAARLRNLHPKPIFDEKFLLEFLARNNAKPVHANTIWRVLLNNHGDFDCLGEIPTFPPKLIPLLKKEFAYCTSRVSSVEQSSLDGTIKLLIALQSGHELEAVIINHTGEDMNAAPTDADPKCLLNEEGKPRVELRKTLCVSSQVGGGIDGRLGVLLLCVVSVYAML